MMRIAEIIGVPGAGKSTLTRALTEASETIQIGIAPSTNNLRDLPFFIWNGLRLVPVLIGFSHNRNKKRLTPQKVAIMAILQGWPQLLMTMSQANKGSIILDQGPLYMLSELLLRYGPTDFSPITSGWWRRVSHEWANVLDLVICLDASDSILLERIRSRETSHQIKTQSDSCAVQFLDRSREALIKVLNDLIGERRDVKVIQIDTSQAPLNEMIQKLSGFLDS